MRLGTLSITDIEWRHNDFDVPRYLEARGRFIKSYDDGFTPSLFITLNYSPTLWNTSSTESEDGCRLLKPTDIAPHVSKLIRGVAKKTNTDLEVFGCCSQHKEDGSKFPHVHFVLMTEKGLSQDTLKEIREAIGEGWKYGKAYTPRFDTLRIDECLSYIYSNKHPYQLPHRGLYCGKKQHGRGKRCPCHKRSLARGHHPKWLSSKVADIFSS